MAATEKIWALFSVDNNYDQPPNNLVAWWTIKPSLETLAKALGHKFPNKRDEITLAIVKIWGGEVQRLPFDTDFRLDMIAEGVV